jgi:hypothetical protein
MLAIKHLTTEEIEAGLEHIHLSPKDHGTLDLIVRRPEIDQREILPAGQLDTNEGLVGDSWKSRPSSRTTDGSAHPEMQLNIMNSRVIALLAQDKERWQLAGDQLFIDLDLSESNIPAGTKLSIGEAILEITALPHSGCKKFAARFGQDAILFVNSPIGKELHMRGVNAKVIQSGIIRTGDIVSRL